jgi:hypothetical protein
MAFPDLSAYYPSTVAGQQSLSGLPIDPVSGLRYNPNATPPNYGDTFTAGGTTSAPPQHIIDYLAQVGTPWDPARYSWDPNTGNLTDRATGGSWDMRSVPNNSLGSYVVLPGGATPTAESSTGTQVENNILAGGGPAYYFEPGQGPTFFGNPQGEGQFFFSNDPAAIGEYQHDARTRQLQGAASVAALVGGAAALGGAGAGGGAGSAGGGLSPITTTASTLPGGVPAVTGAGFGATTASTGLAAMPALGGAGAGLGAASGALSGLPAGAATPGITGGAGAAGAASGATNALGAATSGVPSWIGNYLIPGINAGLGYLASDQATDAQVAASDRAIAENARQFDLTRSDLQPWVTAGQGALGRLQDPNAFTASPDFVFIRSEGSRDIGNLFSAQGGAQSGNALRALGEYTTNLAAGDYNNWFNRQAGIAGVGQNTAVNLGSLGAQSAARTGNYLTNQGNARASGVLGKYTSLAGGANDALYNWLYRRGG